MINHVLTDLIKSCYSDIPNTKTQEDPESLEEGRNPAEFDFDDDNDLPVVKATDADRKFGKDDTICDRSNSDSDDDYGIDY